MIEIISIGFGVSLLLAVILWQYNKIEDLERTLKNLERQQYWTPLGRDNDNQNPPS